jgi:hypothetical protein
VWGNCGYYFVNFCNSNVSAGTEIYSFVQALPLIQSVEEKDGAISSVGEWK